MRNIKLTIEYDGTNYKGWQVQKNSSKTIQETIQKAAKKILKEDIKITGSGRTDSGVHADGQVANFKTNSDKSTAEMQRALNANLPDDIAIIDTQEVNLKFHAQYSIKTKTYRYTILNRDAPCVHNRHKTFHHPYKLNTSLMRKESQHLIGRKDFCSFQASDPAKRKTQKKEDTIRTVKRCEVKKRGDFIYIEIEANGFLYKMVRNIVGTLLEIGRGKDFYIKDILKKKDRTFAGYTAKAKGLTLLQADY